MSQLFALLYKNSKIMSKQRASSLMILLVPIMCLGLAILLQRLAKYISDQRRIDPPFNLPVGGLYPINIPLNLPGLDEIYGTGSSCLRMNKYGFTPNADMYDQHFVDKTLEFNTFAGARKSICQLGPDHGIVSPHFNKTAFRSVEEMNKDLIDQMEKLSDGKLAKVDHQYEPTEGYFLFDKASDSGISATLQSNNMVNFFYHHRSLQTSVAPKNIPVR